MLSSAYKVKVFASHTALSESRLLLHNNLGGDTAGRAELS